MTQTHDVALTEAVLQVSPSVELRQTLASRIGDISPFADRLMRFIEPLSDKANREDGSTVDIEIAVREALANAVIHGNDEDPNKRVFVTCRCTMNGDVLVIVGDEGRGFDPDALPDPTDRERVMRTHGRGIRLMQALMDEVTFEENGTVVRMRKSLQARESEMAAD